MGASLLALAKSIYFIYSYSHLTFGGFEPNWTFAASNQCGLLTKKFCSDQKREFVVLS